MKKVKIKNKKTQKVDQKDLLKAQLARALADYDNLQKRIERQRETMSTLASLDIIVKLLPVFDNFDQVQNHLKDTGLAMALNELTDKLAEEGFVQINPEPGDKFDEEVHEAVEVKSGKNGKKGDIISVSLKGWQHESGHVIRPAKVIVNK